MRRTSYITPDRAVLAGLLLSAAVYCRDLRYSFILDDVPLILMNDTISSWHNWTTLFRTHIFFTSGPGAPTFPAEHYRPVYMLWLMLNEQLFGGVVPWWHLTSLLLHICVVALVYQLGLKLVQDEWTAALAALLFAFHPIHVESVSYVTASTDLLVTLFVLVAFLCYSRFREPGRSLGYLIASLFAAALAMLSKETAAMLPCILVAYEVMRHAPSDTRGRWKQFVWTLPFFDVVAMYAVVRTLLFGGNMGPGPGGSRLAALAKAPLVLLVYLRNLAWPFGLSFFYPVEWTWQWTYAKGAAIVLMVLLARFLWTAYRNHWAVRVQLLWTAILVVPALTAVSVFVREDWVHDRHMYLVSVPFCLIAAAVLTDSRLPRKLAMIASSLIVITFLTETAVQVPRFTDESALYESTLRVAPRNVLAHRYFAFALWNNGKYEEAFREFRTTAELSPKDPSIPAGYAAALAEIGRDDEAETQYAAALQIASHPTPYRASLLYRLAALEVRHSDSMKAAGHLQEALQIAPHGSGYHALLAQALRQQGRTQEANDEAALETSIRRASLRRPLTP